MHAWRIMRGPDVVKTCGFWSSLLLVLMNASQIAHPPSAVTSFDNVLWECEECHSTLLGRCYLNSTCDDLVRPTEVKSVLLNFNSKSGSEFCKTLKAKYIHRCDLGVMYRNTWIYNEISKESLLAFNCNAYVHVCLCFGWQFRFRPLFKMLSSL